YSMVKNEFRDIIGYTHHINLSNSPISFFLCSSGTLPLCHPWLMKVTGLDATYVIISVGVFNFRVK
ncbi:MAG: hypothetical protein LUO84_03680, partial [Methanomassiliicoccales archaeon]|nr:hypothetical protein [Methanomassiliicoccales archaeon]